MTGVPTGTNVYVLRSTDGTHRAYLGMAPLTLAGLTAGRPGVVLDMRQDDANARALLRERSDAADAALASAVSATWLEDLMQPLMDTVEGRNGRAAQPPEAQSATPAVPLPGLATGFGDLDQLTGGLMPGDLWVLTGRSGSGKSILALGFARSAAIRQHARTGYLHARGSTVDVTAIVLSAEARVPLHYLRLGGLRDDDWARLARRIGEVAGAPLLLTDAPAHAAPMPTAAQQIEAGRDLASRHDLKVLLVDDLPAAVTAEELLELKALAVSAGACVVVVVSEGADGRLEDVERSASMAADVVVRVDRDHDMGLSPPGPCTGEADLRVLRHRPGPISNITLAFQGHYGRFSDFGSPSGAT